MDPTYLLRKSLLRRLIDVVGVAALAGPAFELGCGGKVFVDQDGNTGSGGGDTSGTVTGGGGGNADGGACALTSTGAGNGLVQVTECFSPPGQDCPKQYQAAMYITPVGCQYLVSVDCGPVMDGDQCCYLATEQPNMCTPGRPFLVQGEDLVAGIEIRDRGWKEGDLAPALDGLDSPARAALADAWTDDALHEHAAIASFSRFALELMAVGAPAALVAEAHRAALDEVRHARLCFALAQGYLGAPMAPAPFPFDGHVTLRSDLASLAAATAREGCIGETLSALLAAEQLAHAADPAVRRVLEVLAEDEARHAELAWRTVSWALEEGGAPVRRAVLEVFGNAARHLSFDTNLPDGISPALAAAHGRLDAEATRKAIVRALAEVILPCQSVMMAREEAPPSSMRPSRLDEAPETRRSPS